MLHDIQKNGLTKTISVVIPNFNDPRIERAMKSIIQQTARDFELIIVEGCVNNIKTKYIYEKYSDYIDILIKEADKGIFDALNKGIKKATGSLIFLIGADDMLGDNECFSSVIKEYNANSELDGICIGCCFVNSNNKIVRKWNVSNISSGNIKWGIMPPHFSLFLKKSLYEDIGYFDFEKTYVASDTEWLIRLASKRKINIPVLHDHFVFMESGGTSTCSIKYIVKALFVISSAARKHKVKQWPLTPIVKLFSKIPQVQLHPQNIWGATVSPNQKL